MAASETAAIALVRLGLGARPGEMDAVSADPRGWALAQIRRDGAPQPSGDFPDTDRRMAEYLAYQAAGRSRTSGLQLRKSGQESSGAVTADTQAQAAREARQSARRALSEGTADEFLARLRLGATTDQGFAERWALFWSNALTASATRFAASVFIGQYEREAIRPHAFGKFEDLVLAAEQHPAMLLYLDQVRSIGPGSPIGERRRNAGLNENLAREMLELHTVGADAGYTQADVAELARALTGWSTSSRREGPARGRRRARRAGNPSPPNLDAFVFRADVHEPGARTVMGKTYPADGLIQGQTILRDLARHPATARRLSRRIAVHFVADDPPPVLVARLERAWIGSGGDLAAVARALVEAEETWSLQTTKIKTPYEFIVSAHRALGSRPDHVAPLRSAFQEMGQPMFAPPSPEGWPDTVADWAGPDALVKRLDWAKHAGDRARVEDPEAIAVEALGARLGERTRLAIARAESRAEGLTLFLMSPEFQRR